MRVFSSIPFSRSIVLTASMMSRLIPLPLVNQVAPHDRVVRDVRRLAVRDADRQTSVVCGENSALEALPPSDLALRAERDLPADHVPEMGRLAERPLEARRRDGDGVRVE